MTRNPFTRLVFRLPEPSRRLQIGIALAVVLTQAGIAVTGSIVRVTSSGLGCPTWPKCFPDSLTPTSNSNVAGFHQAIEFGNRMLTYVVVAAAAAIVIAVVRAGRRREVKVYAWLIPASTVVQAIVGGITVRTGLLWWTVAIHMLLSMIMVWISVMLLEKVRQNDDGVVQELTPAPIRLLTALSAVAMTGALIAGTMVTGAGPHAGDKSADSPVKRLDEPIVDLVHFHADFVIAYVSILVALAFALLALKTAQDVRHRLYVVIGIAVAQALIGIIQYWTHVPAVLVVLHVAGAAACVGTTAALWSAQRPRAVVPATDTQPATLVAS